jgi:hypothetical protein
MTYINIPSIEEIYNEYHKQTMFYSKGIYPKTIKNFDKIISSDSKEFLIKFQNFLKRNLSSVDWKLYIESVSKYYRRRYDLHILGSLAGTKIYRNFINENYLNTVNENNDENNDENIYNQIINSIKFLNLFLNNSKISFSEYIELNKFIIPVLLNHIYAGTISKYFYACLPSNFAFNIFSTYPDDIFYDLFKQSRDEFTENIFKIHQQISNIKSIKSLCIKIENHFANK